MKLSKKIISALLTVLMLFSALSCVVVYAEEASDVKVAQIYHCVSGAKMPYIFGHTWICIKNISDRTLSCGGQDIQPGQMVSYALHSGGGLKYNREMSQFRNKAVTAVSREINAAQLDAASREILSSSWTYYTLFFHNCTNFSTAVYKAATGKSYNAFIFPVAIKNQFSSGDKTTLYIA